MSCPSPTILRSPTICRPPAMSSPCCCMTIRPVFSRWPPGWHTRRLIPFPLPPSPSLCGRSSSPINPRSPPPSSPTPPIGIGSNRSPPGPTPPSGDSTSTSDSSPLPAVGSWNPHWCCISPPPRRRPSTTISAPCSVSPHPLPGAHPGLPQIVANCRSCSSSRSFPPPIRPLGQFLPEHTPRLWQPLRAALCFRRRHGNCKTNPPQPSAPTSPVLPGPARERESVCQDPGGRDSNCQNSSCHGSGCGRKVLLTVSLLADDLARSTPSVSCPGNSLRSSGRSSTFLPRGTPLWPPWGPASMTVRFDSSRNIGMRASDCRHRFPAAVPWPGTTPAGSTGGFPLRDQQVPNQRRHSPRHHLSRSGANISSRSPLRNLANSRDGELKHPPHRSSPFCWTNPCRGEAHEIEAWRNRTSAESNPSHSRARRS